LVLTVMHFWQIISASLQLSQQKGRSERSPPVRNNRKQHQAKVTQPFTGRKTLAVFYSQHGQWAMSPITAIFVILAFFFCWIIITCGGGGGGAP
jgi:hypothetical protein